MPYSAEINQAKPTAFFFLKTVEMLDSQAPKGNS